MRKILYGVTLLMIFSSALANDKSASDLYPGMEKSVIVDIVMEKITTLLQARKEAQALPYFKQLETMDTELPESFYFYYIDTLDKSGDRINALNRSKAYLNGYGKKGKYYSNVISILSRLSIQQAEEAEKAEKAEKDNMAALTKLNVVVVPAGKFKMGSSSSKNNNPVHSVSINSFALGETEVTQGQWRAVMGNNPSSFSSCGDECPVESVSWDEVQVFIQKLNSQTGKQYRLPSEAEWEYACRAGGQHEYCGSDSVNSVAWYKKNSGKRTHPVSGNQPNAFGLYDMSGNVGEWVEDSYHDNYNGAPTDGSVWQGGSANRVFRGGSYVELKEGIGASERISWTSGDGGAQFIGFRVVRVLP